MKVLIIGLGSIALKHIHAIKSLYSTAQFYALRSGKTSVNNNDVTNIYSYSEIDFKPDFVIVSNPTSEHYSTLKEVAQLNCPLFIEKPVLDNLKDFEILKDLFKKKKIITYVGFSLRFLPCLNYIKENLKANRRINEVNVYCGSYLPDWRPGIDFRKNYSANAEMGGGAHLDLIHELDYVYWFFGKPLKVKRNLKSNSSLNISAVDYANYYLEYENFAVNIILNYFRRDVKRTCEIVCEDETLTIDLIKNAITSSVRGEVFYSEFDKALNYKLQMQYFINCISNNEQSMNTFEDSGNVLKICLNEYA